MRWGAPCAVVSIAVALQCRIAKRMGRVFLNGEARAASCARFVRRGRAGVERAGHRGAGRTGLEGCHGPSPPRPQHRLSLPPPAAARGGRFWGTRARPRGTRPEALAERIVQCTRLSRRRAAAAILVTLGTSPATWVGVGLPGQPVKRAF